MENRRNQFSYVIFHISFVISEFKLEVQRDIVCGFAPEGRNVYSLPALSLLRSSIGAKSHLSARAKVPLPCFAPNGARYWASARSYKHLAPLERKRIQLMRTPTDIYSLCKPGLRLLTTS